jgi:hypothetical protein
MASLIRDTAAFVFVILLSVFHPSYITVFCAGAVGAFWFSNATDYWMGKR